ncbi:hypothetical protein PTW35_00315 [Photobacterium sp. DA100]|uniref:hypothetical protein n=1 Tax=Photobacterium sp. DA100 TaxID=3027472 RepID=UPI0024786424|nr:hypothetical protein [Photobacterium sp. DA100]WEM42353.1 hypothetical protein PTW35_00315 [Photobacterium sp. DA100]
MRLGKCMQIGLLAVGMVAAQATAQIAIQPTEISQQDVEHIQASLQVKNRVSALRQYYDNSDFALLETHLSPLPPLQQEAVRSQLIDYAISSAVKPGGLDQAKADWLEAQAARMPVFNVVEQGDGYLVTKSAFHYGAKARSLVIRWQQQLLAQQMIEQAEDGALQLSQWLVGDIQTQAIRRDIFLAQLPELSETAVEVLAEQFTSDSKLLWLPDNAVIAAVAAASGDEGVYHLLWRRRSDQYSLAELNRLAELAPQPAATKQLMAATINPTLKLQAYRALITLKPLPVAARDFLSDKLSEVDDGELVATELARSGYLEWLEQLASASRSQVLQKNFRSALAKLP